MQRKWNDERVIEMANLLMVIAPDQFRDEELFVTREVLESLGHTTLVVSSRTGKIQGVKGGSTWVDTLVSEVTPTSFDGLVFIGGGGTNVYFDDEDILTMAREMVAAGRVIAAICIAPVILANAGLLAGKEATVFESGADLLRDNGALVQDRPVVIDGRVVTGNGPDAAEAFARAIDSLF